MLTPGDDGFICAQIAEVPEAISQERTLDEATTNVAEAWSWRSNGAVRKARCLLLLPPS